MPSKSVRSFAVCLAVIVAIGFFLIDADAQTRKKRRSSRVPKPVITNPVIQPTDQGTATGGEKIISTADETSEGNDGETAQTTPDKSKKAKPSATPEEEGMQESINTLTNQVNRLTDKLSQMNDDERALLDMERLTRAEQRAESLRGQQVDVESKLADLQSRLEMTDYWLKPENIERANATYGSTRPEEAREARRRQLESEKSRLLAQIKILETSRVRLEQAVANADAEVELCRRRIEQRRAQEETSTSKPSKKPE